MADDEQRNNDERPEEEGQPEDSGLGDLPPLSEFESSSGSSDSGLPPLGDLESDPGAEADEGGEQTSGLPPLGDIPLETPSSDDAEERAQGGGFATPSGQTPSSDDLETPSKGTSFQDLSADSDFTPETPVGASDDEEESSGVPFDSAFGGGESDTSAPTQAMETPMFGQSNAGGQGGGQDMGFGQDTQDSGFGGSDFSVGTPPPDFSQDTGMGGGGQQPPMQYQPAEGGGGGGGGVSVVVTVILLVVGLLVGIVAGPWVASLAGVFPGVLNPYQAEIEDLEQETQQQEATIRGLRDRIADLPETPEGGTQTLDEQIARLEQERDQLTTQVQRLRGEYQELQQARDEIEGDIDELEEQFAEYQDQYQQLQKDTAILQARREGLTAEIERLRSLTGELEEAETRRAMTVDAFQKSLSRLAVLVREGSPLTPEKYSRQDRLEAVRELQAESQEAKWVTPKLLTEFINLYQKELRIAAERSYFFARIPVTDRFGHQSEMWAECLMNGNWSVYYRTLDGDHIGIFTNTNPTGAPDYEFIPVEEKEARSQIESEIMVARPEGFEQQVQQLAERQEIIEGPEGEWQRSFQAL